jgi:hypothetical protein
MTAIKVDVGDIGRNRVILRPTDLLLETADDLQDKLEFAPRMSRITRLWEAAAEKNSPLALLIQAHMQSIVAENPDHKNIESCAEAISKMLHTDSDPLPEAERQLGVRDVRLDPPLLPPTQHTHQAEFGVEDDVSPDQAKIKRIKQWRQVAVRGPDGLKFRNEVGNAYDYRCLFSGLRLPRLEVTDSAGVDQAHVLPWATHNINSVRNGVCLNKLSHWAFDEGVLRLSFDSANNVYVLDIPKEVRAAAKKGSFGLAYFEGMTGPIPRSRLPREKSVWPSPAYLEELNRFMAK